MKIIAGMHRSGTSLVARLFHAAGAEMGDPETFYRPDRWNPEGYFERPEILALNRALLHGVLGRLAYFRLPTEATVLRRGRRLQAELSNAVAAFSAAVVKDPRFSITLPAWRQAGAEIDGVLVCLREPISVAGSLAKRNRATRRHSFYLWREHNRRALAAEAYTRLWFVDYQRLLDPETFPQEAGGALGFFGLHLSAEQLAALGEQTVRRDLDRNPRRSHEYPDRVADLWRELQRRHREQRDGARG